MDRFQVITREKPTMYFFGVTTGQSSSRKMFPGWMDILGKDGQLIGVDLPLNAPPEHYREAVWQIKQDPHSLGALVTTHKINVLNAARDLFDELSQDAQLCGEVACIYKRDGKLIGHAVDPTTSARSMAHFIPADYWQRQPADVLCLGAGGSAVAITVHFLTRAKSDARPHKLILVNRSQGKLDHLQTLVKSLPDSGIQFEFIQNDDPKQNDRLMESLPPYSMVINATGMGKDTPGSPITDAGLFPQHGMAWELNYRGELDFLHQAEAQAEARILLIEDGWRYFVEGWAEVVGHVFDVPIMPPLFAALAKSAESIR